VTVLLLKVLECGSARGDLGSKTAVMPRQPKAPNAKVPPRYLPSVVRSGLRPIRLCSPPPARRNVRTSSMMNTALIWESKVSSVRVLRVDLLIPCEIMLTTMSSNWKAVDSQSMLLKVTFELTILLYQESMRSLRFCRMPLAST
jgi:hypothetical protein